MQVVRFITMDDKKVTCWCETDSEKMFRDFIQYVLDGCNAPEEFVIWDSKTNNVYNMYKLATQHYGMRKRTFDERMNNIQTGKWAGIEL